MNFYLVKALECNPNMGMNEKNDLVKTIEKYGYEMKPQQGGGYYLQGVQNIYIPLGANNPDEEIILKALGFNKTGRTQH